MVGSYQIIQMSTLLGNLCICCVTSIGFDIWCLDELHLIRADSNHTFFVR